MDSKELKFKNCLEHRLFEGLAGFMESFGDVKVSKENSMVDYYSVSKLKNKSCGLFWIDYPKDSISQFRVHFRKGQYSKLLLDKIREYEPDGWGHYPQFYIRDIQDMEKAKEMVKFAYDNL